MKISLLPTAERHFEKYTNPLLWPNFPKSLSAHPTALKNGANLIGKLIMGKIASA